MHKHFEKKQRIINVLPAILTFDVPKEEVSKKNNEGKDENAGYHHFFLFPQCFLLYHRESLLF